MVEGGNDGSQGEVRRVRTMEWGTMTTVKPVEEITMAEPAEKRTTEEPSEQESSMEEPEEMETTMVWLDELETMVEAAEWKIPGVTAELVTSGMPAKQET